MSQEEIPVTQNSDEVQFPVGMRVLALDASSCCLRYLCSLLTACRYKVTATTKAEEALQILRKDTEEFDIVITNIVRQDIDGFELLKIIGTEMGLPVVIVSCLDDQASIRRAIYHGARDYLLKPVRLQEISNIWQHVLRKNLGDPQKSIARKEVQVERSFIPERAEDKLDKEQDETNTQSTETSSSCKKRRFAWTPELHRKFTDAIQELGERKAFPNDILRIMNIPGLTRENVASHLQKYRNTLKKQSTAMAEQKNVELGLTVARGNADIKKGSGAGLETTNMQVTGNYVIRPGIHAPMSPIQSPIFMGQMQQGMYSHVYGDRPSSTLPSDTLLPSLEFKFPNSFPETKLQDGYIGVASRPSCSSRIYSQANPWSRPVSSYNNIAQAGPRNVPPFSYYHIAQADPNPRPPCSNNHPDQAGSSVLDQTGPISTRLYPHPFSVYHHSQVLGDSLSQMGASSQYPSVAWSFQNLQPDQDKRRRCLLNYGETGDTNLKQISIECAEYLKDPKLTDLKGKEPCEGVPYFSAQPDAEIGFNQHGGTCADDEITAIIKEWNNDGPS